MAAQCLFGLISNVFFYRQDALDYLDRTTKHPVWMAASCLIGQKSKLVFQRQAALKLSYPHSELVQRKPRIMYETYAKRHPILLC